jgi:hypothetical protein
MPDHAPAGTRTWGTPSDQTGFVHHGRAGIGDLDLRAIGDGFEEAEEGYLVGSKARICRGRGPDLRYVDWAACESREDQTVWEGFLGCETKRWLGRAGHDN